MLGTKSRGAIQSYSGLFKVKTSVPGRGIEKSKKKPEFRAQPAMLTARKATPRIHRDLAPGAGCPPPPEIEAKSIPVKMSQAFELTHYSLRRSDARSSGFGQQHVQIFQAKARP